MPMFPPKPPAPPTPPRVVHLKRKGGEQVVFCDVYIGRAMNMGGWRLTKSIWANPFTLAKLDNDRAKVIAAYEAHLRNTPLLIAALPELAGKTLGCWCVPEACHGDVLVKLFEELVVPQA
jgi:hypothetical protein